MSGAAAPPVGRKSAPAPSSVVFVQVLEIAVLFAAPTATLPSDVLTAVAPSDRKS